MISARVLVVEDDPRILSVLQRGLRAEGYRVEVARDGLEGLDLARRENFALIVLDRMLPGLEGLEVCARLRREGCPSLIMMLTARDELEDKVDGLRGGADDYLTKPFALGELLARLEALLRRGRVGEGASAASPQVLQVGDLRLDLGTKAVRRGECRIDLTAKEFALLAYLMANAGTVVSRAKLLSNVWGMNFDPGTKLVDVYISYLRRKVDEDEAEPLIQTVRGFGYMVSTEEAASE
jgi:two-component system, OmpR family, response regulator